MLKLRPLPLPLKKLKKETIGNLNSQQLRLEFQAAIKRYTDAHGGGKFSRKRLIYSRPWFLVCGHEGSGKSTLLDKTGLSWNAVYPDDRDGLLQWRFGNEAVWIDMAGSLFEESAAADFQIFLETLAWLRPRRPLDGIILVTDCGMMLDTPLDRIKSKGDSLRKRIDHIIRLWGIEVPVYHIFSKADKITGFNVIFSDPAGKWNERALGATLTVSSRESNPKESFLEELFFVLDWIKEIQVKMLARDQNQANRRLICQFPIIVESLREKISCLIAAIFKKSDITGRPLFGGFFFTSCQSGGGGMQEPDDHIFDIGKTIISHPLNPQRKRGLISTGSPKGDTPGATTAYFSQPLFTNIIPKHAAPISTTDRKLKQNMISLFWKSGAAIAAIVIFSVFEWWAAAHVHAIDKKVRTDFSTPVAHSRAGIRHLDSLYHHYLAFQNYAERGRTFPMVVTRYNAKRMYATVSDAFFSSVFSTIVIPGFKELNDSLNWMVSLSDNNPENDFLKLKRLLQTYLAVSDMNRNYKDLINEKVVVPTMYKMAITSIFGTTNAASGLDSILMKVNRAYVAELKRNGAFKYTIKADTNLVATVRKKLAFMFNADAVYAMARNDLAAGSKNLELIDIVGSSIPLNMRSTMSISEIYTPDGWNGVVKKKFKEASKQREHLEDWALGENKEDFSDIFRNPQLLYDGLVGRYSDDVKTQWRNFLNAVSMERFGSFRTAQERLLQISGAQSDIAGLIGKFADWSGKFIATDSEKTKELPFIKFNDEMAFLRHFTGANLPLYQKQFEEVAKGLAKASEENSVLGIFTGREGDPLFGAYQFLYNSAILPLSKDQKGFLEHLLMEPYNRTVDIVKPELVRNISARWKEVYDVFDGSLNRQYPFTDGEKEASFDATMTFFNPATGPFWKTYNDYLSPYVAKNRWSKYTYRDLPGTIPVQLSPAFLKCLDKADTISYIFFKDGKRRSWKVTISPQSKQSSSVKKLKKAVFTIGKQTVSIIDEREKPIKWPVEGDEPDVALHLTDNLDRDGKLLLHGPWSLMRLMNSSCYYSGNSFQSGFDVLMKTKHNVIEISLPAGVTVSSTDPGQPFNVNIFKGFTIPKTIFLSGDR